MRRDELILALQKWQAHTAHIHLLKAACSTIGHTWWTQLPSNVKEKVEMLRKLRLAVRFVLEFPSNHVTPWRVELRIRQRIADPAAPEVAQLLGRSPAAVLNELQIPVKAHKVRVSPSAAMWGH